MTDAEKRRAFQKLKSLTHAHFWEQMNEMHTRAYALAEKHYREAMAIVLQPKQAQAVIAKAAEIRESWDGIETVTVDDTEGVAFDPGGEANGTTR